MSDAAAEQADACVRVRMSPLMDGSLDSLNVNVAVLAGGLYFGEFEQLATPRRVAGFVAGLGVSLGGVVWLARVKPAEPAEPVQPAEHTPLKKQGGTRTS